VVTGRFVRVIKGDKREVPGDLPILYWWDRVAEVQAMDLSFLPWHHEWLEYLTTEEIQRTKAKALVWREVEGDWPDEVVWWWEIRMARRRGDIPHISDVVEAQIDEDGVLHCGYCKARWSANFDGTPHPDRCKLCDRTWVVIEDARDKETYSWCW
jgi:hypothetical protein